MHLVAMLGDRMCRILARIWRPVTVISIMSQAHPLNLTVLARLTKLGSGVCRGKVTKS